MFIESACDIWWTWLWTQFCISSLCTEWHVYPINFDDNTKRHNSDVIMSEMASQITGIAIACWTVCSGADQRKKLKPRIAGLCEGNQAVTGGFPSHMTSNAENVSIWWRHHGFWCSHGKQPIVQPLPPGPTFIKPDQRNPWIKDQLWNGLLSTILHLQLPNFVSCGRDKPSHMTQNLVTVGVKL